MMKLIILSLLSIELLYSQGGPARNIISGPNTPSRCSPKNGDVWFKTASPSQFCTCAATNTWVCTSNGVMSGPGSGTDYMLGVTSGGSGWAVADVAGTPILYMMPTTNGTAGQALIDNGVATCGTYQSGVGLPTTCHQLIWGSAGGGLTSFVSTTYTQGGNLTLLAQTTPQTITLASAVSCNNFFSGSAVSITTSFTGGTGGLWGQLFHGSVAIGPLVDLTATAGNLTPDVPGMGCVGAATNDLKFIISGDGSNNLSGYTAGAVKVSVIGSAI